MCRRPPSVILVGRVFTEVVGGEQCLGLIERYKLSRQSFLESLAGVRSVGSLELDRIATFVRRLASSFIAADSRLENRSAMLERRQGLLDFARKATAFHDRGPGQTRGMLEFLGRVLAVPGSAILLESEDARRVEVLASVGLGEDALHVLAHQDWARIFEQHGQGARLYLPDRQEMLRAGLDLAAVPLAAQRLTHGPRAVGCLVVTGAALSGRDLDLLESASVFVAANVVHQKCRELVEQKDEEARLVVRMAEKCLTAHSLEELLPLALEAAMHSLHARRGSILLAGEEGRITASALRGDHAPISGSIEMLRPDSVSHKVFFNRCSMLVQDADREPGLTRERQFPYATRSFVSVPLRENGHALGVLHLTEREGEAVFTRSDLSLLERMSLQAAGAIGKARLEEEVQQLRIKSTTDHLTGVHNRRYFDEQLVNEFQRASRFGLPLALAMLDIDDFKALNDEMGHGYGDQVLKEVAGTVRQQLRSVDIMARYGGDEFALVLPGTDIAGAMSTIEKIRAVVEAKEFVSSRSPSARSRCTISVGISVFPDTASAADDLLRRADQALFQSKRAGRNTALLWKN
jgi:diguanylate cyclase (GGDEF)-like protein